MTNNNIKRYERVLATYNNLVFAYSFVVKHLIVTEGEKERNAIKKILDDLQVEIDKCSRITNRLLGVGDNEKLL